MRDVLQSAASGRAEVLEEPSALRAAVLIVDDDERNAFAISTVLEPLGQELVVARSGEEALKQLLLRDFAVILLDLHMPGMDGYETAALIRSRQRSRDIPIVFVTAVFRDESHLLQAYSAGAVDMVFKPVDPFVLKSKVSVFVDLYLRRAEVRREAELRHRLQEENFRVRTEKLLAEQALQRSEQRQEAILASLPVCIQSRDACAPFRTVFISPAAEQITGFSPERFTAEPGFLASHIHPEDADRVHEVLSCVGENGSYSHEFRFLCADGQYRYLLDQGVLAEGSEGRPAEIFGTLLDVTEQRAMEQQLVQAQKMETVGQLTGGVAHDFNNLLTVILGNLDLLERHIGDNERMRRQFASIRHASERGYTLTRQLLAFSRRQHLTPQVIDVRELLAGFQALLRRAVGEAIALSISMPDVPAICEVDPAQLESAILNLAVNARDAMPNGGKITIELRTVEQASRPGLGEGDSDGPWISISTRDNGSGMPTAVRDRAFEPFFTTKQTGKGSGLGLSQVYGFVRQSGGFVTVESEVGAGTEICIFLPVSMKSPERMQSTGVEERVSERNSETILLVEDDSNVLALAIEMLTDLGYSVRTASDAAGAMEILRRDERIDLLFTDIVMPGGRNGVELAGDARQLRPELPILLASGYSGHALTENRVVFDLELIEKPYRQKALAEKIRTILDRSPSTAH